MHLSPVLVQLGTSAAVRRHELITLDAACLHLPVMTVIVASMPLAALVTHLRSLLLIEADTEPYLLRFADSQTLGALNAALTPEQRAQFFQGIVNWWTVDHAGACRDAAALAGEPRSVQAPLPLQLDTAQIERLLEGVAAPVLAAQLRQLESTFAGSLAHAEQIAYAVDCIGAAQHQGVDEDAGLTSLALQRWRGRDAAPGAPKT